MGERTAVVAGIMSHRVAATRGAGVAVPVETFLPAEDLQVRHDAPVHTAAALMLAELVTALPVVDDDGRVVGVVTWSDIVAHVAGQPPDPRP